MKKNRNRFKPINNYPDVRQVIRSVLFACYFLGVLSLAFAQSPSITLELKNVTVESLLHEIRNQTDISFIFNHEELNKAPLVSISVMDVLVNDVLKQGLKDTGLTFETVSNTIVIKPIKKDADNIPGESGVLKQTIRGQILDKDSKAPLIGANVMVVGVTPLLGASTDIDGNFKISNVPIGRQQLKVTFIGYEEIITPDITVTTAKEVVLHLELTELIGNLETLVFVAKVQKDLPVNEMASVSARSFTVEEASRYAGSFADPARMATSYAGVVSNNSFTNEITVRGNSPKGLLWRLEGVEIPSPNHLSGYSRNGGIVTILSTNVMDNSDFMTGAFPSEYGNATSGVFDIKLRNGNNEKAEYSFQSSFFGIEAAAEGPLKKGYKGSYLINYRYATTSILADLGLVSKDEGLPTWQDLTFKVNLPTKKLGDFQVFGSGGLSGVNETALKDTLDWEYEYNNIDAKFHSNIGSVGVSNRVFLGEKTYLKTVLATTIRDTGHHSDSVDTQFQKYYNGQSKTVDHAVILSSFVNHKFNANSVIRTGAILSAKTYSVFAEDISPTAPYIIKPLLDTKGEYVSLQSYIQWKYRLTKHLELNTGVHSFYTAFNNNSTIEPRASIRWDLKARQSLSFGYGMHSRLESGSIYFEKLNVNGVITTPNKDLKLARSIHYVLSYNKMFNDHLRMKVETYYQTQSKVPISTNPMSSFSVLNSDQPVTGEILANKGTGTNKGIELTLEKFMSNHYYFLLTGSLYDAEYKAADGVTRDTRYNGNYVANFLTGKEIPLQRNRSISIDIRMTVAGGNRVTPIDLAQSRAKHGTVYYTEKSFTEQAPTYFRPDFKLSYTKNKPKTKQVLSLDIQNVINQQNLLSTYYDKRQDDIVKSYQFGMLPNIAYKIQF